MKAKIALENGRIFEGRSFGARGEAFGELVFNTSMTGYQEILTDPSYKGQIVAMTYPLIGNYGVNSADLESGRPQVSGFVVKESSRVTSNWRSQAHLGEYLAKNKIISIEGVDTRALTKEIRQKGAMKAVISTKDSDNRSLVRRVRSSEGLTGKDLVKEVTCIKPYYWSECGSYKIIVIDCGVKHNILRKLAERNCSVHVVPASFSGKGIIKENPDGVLLSNGPGDPTGVPYLVETVKSLLGKTPILGICLGHQILALALGGGTYKLKFGHHGGNQPVKELASNKVAVTAQNHNFSVAADTLPADEVEITHINLNDRTIEGMRHRRLPVISVQFHPESSPGPHDSGYLFDRFIEMIGKR